MIVRMRILHNHCVRTADTARKRQRTTLYNHARLQSFLKGEVRLRRNKVMQPSGREAQRLTGYIRAFGGVSADISREPVLVDETFVRRKQKIQRASSVPEKKWVDVKSEITARCGRSDLWKVQTEIRNLHQATREIVGDDVSTAVVDSAAVFLYTLFSSDRRWSREHAEKMRKKLGPFPASAANRACESVKKIMTLSPERETDSQRTMENPSSVNADAGLKKEFGHNVVFSAPTNLLEKITGSSEKEDRGTGTSEGAHDSLSEDEALESDAFSRAFLNGMASKGKTSDPNRTDGDKSKTESSVGAATMATGGPTPYSSEWLAQQLQACHGGGSSMSWHDLYRAVFDLLSSTQDSTVIQNDLAELLGLTELDLIQELLIHRQELVSSALDNSTLLLTRVKDKGQTQGSIIQSSQQRPSISSQVVIQSGEEKALRKLLRKEEKKQARCKREGGAGEDHAAQLRAYGFDPKELRKQREQALEEASFRPLLTSHTVTPDPSSLYPHVYDSLARAKLTAAYVAGAKVGVPEGTERKTDRIMEEFHIPHSSAPPPPVGEERIRIAEIDDDIIQLAFKGTKTLNRIQSIVFDVAYYTSENLLISAPTGAGKTNIAMLTVLREIKNNIEGGVIKRDTFKIVYVAPMKALAAEMVRNFGARLSPLGITVKELTGDMQMTKSEIRNTQMIVTTPEKWDVVTRKATGDVQLAQIVRLLIIDEIHLLHEDRGAVIESLVARTLRQVESSQTLIRIVGLSATLPNYLDVARFLHVNFYQGLFFFDGRFRPVPLSQTFVGVKATNRMQQMRDMEEVCYEKVLNNVRRGYQVMVFVHARNATVRTATALRDLAASSGDLPHFQHEQTPRFGAAEKQVSRSRNKQLRDLFNDGFSIHHAGMLRVDRNLVERMFADGFIKVLVCTATLAWGVNLPAHAVIIKGTQVYNAQKGAFIDLGILDVLQIFGRAGRPQYDTYGEGTIITTHDKLSHYVSLLTRQHPIESRLKERLRDNLNAEIALGTVTSVEEAVQWLSYTYLNVRMRMNPLVYGIPNSFRETDPTLELYMRGLVESSARFLNQVKMVRFIEHTGNLHSTDLGRTASHFYIKTASIETFTELLKPYMNDGEILAMVSKSEEFEQVKVREDEQSELEQHRDETCMLPVKGGVENSYGKVNILLQVYISREAVESFSLTSDLAYVAQNAGRIIRGLFEIVLRRGWPVMASRLLTLCRSVDHQLWSFQHPLRQFGKHLSQDILRKLEEKKTEMHRLKDMSADEIGHMIYHPRMGTVVKKVLASFPSLSLAATIQPITRTVLRVRLCITPEFEWDDKIHGSSSEPWWLWVEDAENNTMYHSEYFLLQKKQVQLGEPQELVFAIPISDPLPPQYIIKATSDRWLCAEAAVAISFKHLILPEIHPPHTKLLDLHPLPVSALKNSSYEQLLPFPYFNPIQTQVFHTLYHSDSNVLLGAPTGSGKTIAAELAIFRVFNCHPGGKAVYIAPLKALVRERVDDWRERMEWKLGKKVVELTGDSSPDIRAIERADVIVTTPEKWDGVSRSWQNRAYVQAVRLLVIDEIHLLGDERGPVLEVIVSRSNFIASHTEHKVRVVGLSTALANAKDLADWLEIKQDGLFNFHPAVRPVQLEVHIDGFPGKHYCPRMATMNKPTYTAIRTYSPTKPVLVFVSSRRQTRLTAFDLVAYVAREDNPKQWLHMAEDELDTLLQSVQDQNLRFTLAFGVGLHHAGLQEKDRKIVEKLFVDQKIQALIATSTLAWGVNFPAHLVVVKGTEYFDGKTQRYVDYPITDVLQMMGRAGRPQYDDRGVAVILVHDIKKHFYKKFLYEPFPVESNLLQVLADHLNAEIVSGTVTSKQDALDYLTWTYFFRRLLMNPSYYQLEETDSKSVNSYLSKIVETSLSTLQASYCIEIDDDDRTLLPLSLGCIASYYYLHHKTVKLFKEKLHPHSSFEELLLLLSDCSEYDELPVRHNEDNMNASLAPNLPIPVSPHSMDSAHTKTHLLLQAHFSRAQLPIADYGTDTKSVLDQALRILQAMIDVAASEGWLAVTLRIMTLVQMCIQGRWASDSSLLTLPYMGEGHTDKLNSSLSQSRVLQVHGLHEITCLAELVLATEVEPSFVEKALVRDLARQDLKKLVDVLSRMPVVTVTWKLKSLKPDKPVKRDSSQGQRWVEVGVAEECAVIMEITRSLQGKHHAYAPKFPKAKDEGWWVLIGEVDSGELVALKRLGFLQRKKKTTLAFTAPEEPCRKIYSLYLISDCYLGLDQQQEMCLNFVANSNE